MNYILILNNIRSAQNVGALFRTADAAGISEIYLVGYTPTPLDRFNRPRSDISKAALGAEKNIPWQSTNDLSDLIQKLKKEGYTIIAIEQSSKSTDYKKIKAADKTAFIVGNEVDGLSEDILDTCDFVAEIPMKGEKESLNVSVSAGIAIFRILDI